MNYSLKRKALQGLAEAKLEDAILLLKYRRFANSFYLAGYSIELALKACVAKMIQKEVIPDKKLIERVYSHNLAELVGVAGLRGELKYEQDNSEVFREYWGLVTQWGPESRYESTDKTSAQLLVNAIVEPKNGVMPWLRKHW